MSTIGTLICGSSSRGSATSAIAPATMAASSSSGVSGELMKARVSSPDSPSFMANQPVAVLQAGEDLDVGGACGSPGWTTTSAPSASFT